MKKQRVVVKIGTNILTHPDGSPHLDRLHQLVEQICTVITPIRDVLLVSSGAISCGLYAFKNSPQRICEKQAAAAVGQTRLMTQYKDCFAKHDCHVAQLLVTKDGLSHKTHKKNILNTITTLWDNHIFPIINENDSVSTDEIGSQFGDNDSLSAYIAHLIGADFLVILTDTDGLLSHHPSHPDAQLIEQVDVITDDTFKLCKDQKNHRSKGGMLAKLHAANFATQNGVDTVIANGETNNVLHDILNGFSRGTLFHGKRS